MVFAWVKRREAGVRDGSRTGNQVPSLCEVRHESRVSLPSPGIGDGKKGVMEMTVRHQHEVRAEAFEWPFGLGMDMRGESSAS